MVLKKHGLGLLQYLESNFAIPQKYVKKLSAVIYQFLWKVYTEIKKEFTYKRWEKKRVEDAHSWTFLLLRQSSIMSSKKEKPVKNIS